LKGNFLHVLFLSGSRFYKQVLGPFQVTNVEHAHFGQFQARPWLIPGNLTWNILCFGTCLLKGNFLHVLFVLCKSVFTCLLPQVKVAPFSKPYRPSFL
jgi:hypothetical protein